MNKTIGLLLMPLEYVTDGQRYGMIVERIQGKESFGRIIADHPERLEELAGMTADYAYRLAVSQLGATDLDILSENIGIQNLCYVYVVKQGGGPAGLCRIFDVLNGYQPGNMTIAKKLFEQAQKLSFE